MIAAESMLAIDREISRRARPVAQHNETITLIWSVIALFAVIAVLIGAN